MGREIEENASNLLPLLISSINSMKNDFHGFWLISKFIFLLFEMVLLGNIFIKFNYLNIWRRDTLLGLMCFSLSFHIFICYLFLYALFCSTICILRPLFGFFWLTIIFFWALVFNLIGEIRQIVFIRSLFHLFLRILLNAFLLVINFV